MMRAYSVSTGKLDGCRFLALGGFTQNNEAALSAAIFSVLYVSVGYLDYCSLFWEY